MRGIRWKRTLTVIIVLLMFFEQYLCKLEPFVEVVTTNGTFNFIVSTLYLYNTEHEKSNDSKQVLIYLTYRKKPYCRKTIDSTGFSIWRLAEMGATGLRITLKLLQK